MIILKWFWFLPVHFHGAYWRCALISFVINAAIMWHDSWVKFVISVLFCWLVSNTPTTDTRSAGPSSLWAELSPRIWTRSRLSCANLNTVGMPMQWRIKTGKTDNRRGLPDCATHPKRPLHPFVASLFAERQATGIVGFFGLCNTTATRQHRLSWN